LNFNASTDQSWYVFLKLSVEMLIAFIFDVGLACFSHHKSSGSMVLIKLNEKLRAQFIEIVVEVYVDAGVVVIGLEIVLSIVVNTVGFVDICIVVVGMVVVGMVVE
jgi:hypothetical protein